MHDVHAELFYSLTIILLSDLSDIGRFAVLTPSPLQILVVLLIEFGLF